MPRKGYVNFPITDIRQRLFRKLARALDMDPEQHRHQVEMLQYGLELATVMVMPAEARQEENDVVEMETR